VKNNIHKYEVILFSDYLKGVLTDKICFEIIGLAKNNNVITIVDSKEANYKKYKNIDLIKSNLNEVEKLIREKLKSPEAIKAACENLKNLLCCKYVVVTLDENGIALLNEKFEIIPIQSCQVFDVSEASNTLFASLAICLKQKYSLNDACDFSIKAALLVTRKAGRTTTTIQEVINLN
jgi:D-beta-D-heptose 7-phosphate kinase/D-beta-D-heptose 1-phosphate adenosyltransferase